MQTIFKVDSKWFRRLIAARNIQSQAEAARRMGISSSYLSLILSGERALQMEEAKKMATLLGVPLSEVAAHFGGPVQDAVKAAAAAAKEEPAQPAATSALDVVGSIDAFGVVHWKQGGRKEAITLPVPVPDGAKAIIYKTANTLAEQFDGWSVIIAPGLKPTPAEMVGRYAIVTIKSGETHFRVVRKGEKAGRYTLTATHLPPIYDAQIEKVYPVISIQPPADDGR